MPISVRVKYYACINVINGIYIERQLALVVNKQGVSNQAAIVPYK